MQTPNCQHCGQQMPEGVCEDCDALAEYHENRLNEAIVELRRAVEVLAEYKEDYTATLQTPIRDFVNDTECEIDALIEWRNRWQSDEISINILEQWRDDDDV